MDSKTKNKIAIFYHIYQFDNWVDIYNEQIDYLYKSGLLNNSDIVYLGVNGDKELPIIFENFKVVRNNDKDWQEETPTLCSLLEFAKVNKDYRILYIHTKGVTHYADSAGDWRRMMQYFCIEKWKEALELLKKYDAIGTNFSDDHYWGNQPHFSGNFWWANSNYIESLDHSYLLSDLRYDREFWIGSGNGKLFNIHGDGVQNYHIGYPESIYKY